jgi:mono/diheme cytochrome c family protein
LLKRVAIGLVVLFALGVSGFLLFAWEPTFRPIERPAPASFAPTQVMQGEQLAEAGFCGTCHTAKGGQPFAGGYPMATQFGTIYSTNITPDVETGIGNWSLPAFNRAMHEGIARNGAHLFPAFPYDHFTKLRDEDVAALYAYFMTRDPVHATPPRNTVPFPLKIRLMQAGWKLLFFRMGRFQPDKDKSEDWNRGAYLAESLSHCGACHTPRNGLGAEKRHKAYAGAAVDNWIAPALTAANPTPVAWNVEELEAYLRTGISKYHGTAAGPMAPVVHGLARIPQADVHALAVYFADISEAAKRTNGTDAALARAAATSRIGTGPTYDPAARLTTAACASCHYNGADKANALRPELALTSAVTLDDPTNLIQVILHGISAKDGAPGVVMPAFTGFTDADIARIAAYLRATRTSKPAWPDLERTVARIRKQDAAR